MQSILNLKETVTNSDQQHQSFIEFENISELQEKGDNLIQSSLKIISELKKNLFFSFGSTLTSSSSSWNIIKAHHEIILSDDKVSKINHIPAQNKNLTNSNLLNESPSSELTLTHVSGDEGHLSKKEYLYQKEDCTQTDLRVNENDDDDDKSDAASFMTARDEWDENDHHHHHVCPAIVLPDFSFTSFMKAIVTIQTNLGSNDALKHLIPAKKKEEEEGEQRIKSTTASVSTVPLPSSSSSFPAAPAPPLHPAQRSIFASSLSYLYSKLQTLLPSTLVVPSIPMLPPTIARVKKPSMVTRLQRKINGLRTVPLFVSLPHAFVKSPASKKHTRGSITSTTSTFASSVSSIAKRMSPSYAYQIRFLVKTYGLKETANILAQS